MVNPINNLAASCTSSCTEYLGHRCQRICNTTGCDGQCYFINDHTYRILKKICHKILRDYNRAQSYENYTVFDGGNSCNMQSKNQGDRNDSDKLGRNFQNDKQSSDKKSWKKVNKENDKKGNLLIANEDIDNQTDRRNRKGKSSKDDEMKKNVKQKQDDKYDNIGGKTGNVKKKGKEVQGDTERDYIDGEMRKKKNSKSKDNRNDNFEGTTKRKKVKKSKVYNDDDKDENRKNNIKQKKKRNSKRNGLKDADYHIRNNHRESLDMNYKKKKLSRADEIKFCDYLRALMEQKEICKRSGRTRLHERIAICKPQICEPCSNICSPTNYLPHSTDCRQICVLD